MKNVIYELYIKTMLIAYKKEIANTSQFFYE
jgi:hypothetical protein